MLKIDENPNLDTKLAVLHESTLKATIEDLSLRTSEFMQFKGRILPEGFVGYFLTKENEDGRIISEMFKGLSIPTEGEFQDLFNWLIKRWNSSDSSTFNFLSKLRSCPNNLKKHLGIGVKETTTELEQPKKMRYSSWMSNLMVNLAKDDKTNLSYFQHLALAEYDSPHPVSNISIEIIDSLFETFSHTNLAGYSSRIKNFYSRIDGAKGKPICIFPLYSSGKDGSESVKKVTGFVISGPQNSKKPTETIPIMTFEMFSNEALGFKKFIKNPNFMIDNLGRHWCVRINSVNLLDTSHLSFVINSVYHTANIVQEITNRNPTILGIDFVKQYKVWLMERAVECVLMECLGSAQDEEAMVIVKKLFRIKISMDRGEIVYATEINGLAEDLNKCLFDQPLGIYYIQHMRNSLKG